MRHCASPPSCLGDDETCTCECASCVDARAELAGTRSSDRAGEAAGLVRTLAAEHQRYAQALITICEHASVDTLVGRIARRALLEGS